MSPCIERLAKSSTIERLLGDRRGQSFIEAMVAITIIVSSITSSLALVQSSITASRAAGSQVVAANLAREGIEVARALRDTNWLASNGFSQNMTNGSFKTALPVLSRPNGTWSLVFGNYTIDSTAATVWQATDGLYLQAASQPTGTSASVYSRLLRLDYLCRDNATGAERIVTAGNCLGTETMVGLAVSSSVKWTSISGPKRVITTEERLYDWR